jgi:hypothetical protein
VSLMKRLIWLRVLRTIRGLGSGVVDEPRVNPFGDVGGMGTITRDSPCHRSVHDRVAQGHKVASVIHDMLIGNELSVSVHC